MNYIAARITDAERLFRIKAGLKCSDQEAAEILVYDKKVEKGEPTEYDLPPEKEKIARKFAHTGTRKTPIVPNPKPRARKENATKAGIIAELAEFLVKNSQFAVENCEIANKERKISFSIGGQKFDLTLIQKRKAK